MRPRRRVLLGAGGVVVVALVAVVLVWFQPQTLLFDTRVDDALPGGAGEDGTGMEPAAAEVVARRQGSFVSLAHTTSGGVRIVELPDGRRFVRLDDLATDNGPDLFLYLSANPADGARGAFDDDFVSLGRLQGNLGNQNYELPPDVDITRWRSVVIWCDRFDVAFGAADLVDV